MKKTFYITTPIYYVNDIPHIGHAYTTIAADVLARYKRSQGYKVYFLTGTDEHGEKIVEAAREKQLDLQEFINLKASGFTKAWNKLNISNDDFIRTSENRHKETVVKIFDHLQARGDIYKGEYEGLYCTPCESFWTETQLNAGKCPQCSREVHLLKEESYFFKLSKYEKNLLEYIQKNPDFIQPESRKNEIINFIKQGLKDLSITRTSFEHGIKLPGAAGHVIYVWFDALINYISALGYDPNGNKFEKKYWPADVHIRGKEIVRFHAVIWPAILMALHLPLPRKVFGHGWWTVEGQKMSKSLGNVVDPLALAEQYGVDAVRYFLLREVPFGSDGDFSLQNFKRRFNTDLANDIGNLFSRSLNMCEKYFASVNPERVVGELTENDKEIWQLMKDLPGRLDNAMNRLAFSEGLDRIWELVNKTNKYIEISAPWILAKENKAVALANVVGTLIEVLKTCAQSVASFMPQTTEKMLQQLKILKKGEPLFPRLEL
jgi:methionyl-tRNA synthetase